MNIHRVQILLITVFHAPLFMDLISCRPRVITPIKSLLETVSKKQTDLLLSKYWVERINIIFPLSATSVMVSHHNIGRSCCHCHWFYFASHCQRIFWNICILLENFKNICYVFCGITSIMISLCLCLRHCGLASVTFPAPLLIAPPCFA